MKKSSLIEGGKTPVDTSRRDLAERRAQPCQTAIENKPVNNPRVPMGRPRKLKK